MPREQNPFTMALIAHAPAPELAARAKLYGQFVGAWQAEGEAFLPDGSRRAERVEATQIAMAREPGRAWKLGELADEAGCSPFYLARTFHSVVGMPLHRYELRARLAAALDAVLDTSQDLTTIALELAFSSHSHFTHVFRRAFGITPSALRKHGTRARS